MVAPSPLTVRWLVAFTDVETRGGPIRRALGFLRPGYRHCLAFRGVGKGLLIVQTTMARVQVDWFPAVTEADYRQELESKGATVLEVEQSLDDSKWGFRFMSCVSLIRGLVGWRSQWQTPAGLAAEIVKRKG